MSSENAPLLAARYLATQQRLIEARRRHQELAMLNSEVYLRSLTAHQQHIMAAVQDGDQETVEYLAAHPPQMMHDQIEESARDVESVETELRAIEEEMKAVAGAGAVPTTTLADQLKDLGRLRDAGGLTDTEFSQSKSLLFDRYARGQA